MTQPTNAASKSPRSLYVAPIALAIIAAYHVVEDFRWHYNWGFVDPYNFYIYSIAAAVFVINVFSRRWDSEVALWARRASFALIALVGSWVHTQTVNGFEWVHRQTTADIPANLSGEQADRYWAAYTERLGDVGAFGGIRKLYETYGQSLTLNNQTIFLDAINSSDMDDLHHILDAVDGRPWPLPLGYLAILFALIGQVFAYRSLRAVSTVVTGEAAHQ